MITKEIFERILYPFFAAVLGMIFGKYLNKGDKVKKELEKKIINVDESTRKKVEVLSEKIDSKVTHVSDKLDKKIDDLYDNVELVKSDVSQTRVDVAEIKGIMKSNKKDNSHSIEEIASMLLSSIKEEVRLHEAFDISKDKEFLKNIKRKQEKAL